MSVERCRIGSSIDGSVWCSSASLWCSDGLDCIIDT